MTRRDFMRFLSKGVFPAALVPRNLETSSKDKRPIQFVFAQLKYRGGDWNPHPLAVTPLMDELMLRTSVEAATVRHEVAVTDRDLFNYPFLYIAGKYEFDPFTQDKIEILRLFLSYLVFHHVNDAHGHQGYDFENALRRKMQRIFPGNEFKRLPAGHAALRSYYLLRSIGGVRIANPNLEGITIGNSTPVIYCQNDLGGAWEK